MITNGMSPLLRYHSGHWSNNKDSCSKSTFDSSFEENEDESEAEEFHEVLYVDKRQRKTLEKCRVRKVTCYSYSEKRS